MRKGLKVSFQPVNSHRIYGHLVGYTNGGVLVNIGTKVVPVAFRDLTYEG